jgi:hypothetical protein
MVAISTPTRRASAARISKAREVGRNRASASTTAPRERSPVHRCVDRRSAGGSADRPATYGRGLSRLTSVQRGFLNRQYPRRKSVGSWRKQMPTRPQSTSESCVSSCSPSFRRKGDCRARANNSVRTAYWGLKMSRFKIAVTPRFGISTS